MNYRQNLFIKCAFATVFAQCLGDINLLMREANFSLVSFVKILFHVIYGREFVKTDQKEAQNAHRI